MVVDESMVKGISTYVPSHMFLRRKSDPLRRELQTVCNGLTSLCFRMELVENASLIKGKEFYTEFGKITATRLGLMKPFFGNGRKCQGDRWFRPMKSCNGLLERGACSVLNVKTTYIGFPKAKLQHLLPMTLTS